MFIYPKEIQYLLALFDSEVLKLKLKIVSQLSFNDEEHLIAWECLQGNCQLQVTLQVGEGMTAPS